ncbi:MAG: permease prefix domain 2-containing transporter, partial [Bacteroidota bacterium]
MKGESHIPKWAEKFLSWYCRHEILEEIQGDLYELFDKRAKKKSVRFARRRFIWDVLRTFRLSTIKHVQLPNNLAMLSHNLRFTFRRFTRQKLNTSLHLVGLTIGITVCLLIGLFIRHELTYDTYHAKADRIYRVNQVWEVNEEKYLHYGAPTPLAGALREGRPEIEAIGVAFPQNERIVEINPRNKFLQPNIVLADTGLLDVFDFTIIQGDAKRTLSEPNHAILTKSTAEKFFGLQDPIGKTFTYREDKVITVGAIMEDLPTNTHLPASILLTFSKTEDFIVSNLNNWGLVYGASTYVVLGKGVDPTSLHAPIRELYDTHLNDPDEDPEIGYAELQALTNIHTNTEVAGGGKLVKAISPGVLWFFGGISIGVLLLACFNFINLSTTQAITRIKEVGVRKVIGAGRRQLINQFLLEAFVLLGLSALLAVLLTHLLLPEVNGLIKKDIAISSMYQAEFIGLTILCLIAIGLFSGWYPAWLTAKIQPATAVKASYSSSDKTSNWLRKGLVVAQFSLSAGLLLAMIIMSRQMKYFHEANLGFDRENILS